MTCVDQGLGLVEVVLEDSQEEKLHLPGKNGKSNGVAGPFPDKGTSQEGRVLSEKERNTRDIVLTPLAQTDLLVPGAEPGKQRQGTQCGG